MRSSVQQALSRQRGRKTLRVAGAAAPGLAEIAVRAEMGSHLAVSIDGDRAGATGTGQALEHGGRIDVATAKQQ
jgi:hypothetical protein